jgi:hypothetical protein
MVQKTLGETLVTEKGLLSFAAQGGVERDTDGYCIHGVGRCRDQYRI